MTVTRQVETADGARRVAVTGASSFLGRGLLSRLAADPEREHVLALDVEPPELPGSVAFRRLDLTRPTAAGELREILRAHRIDTLVHLAFLSGPTHQQAWAHELEAIGTLHVLDACAEHGVRKLVMQSSTTVYGPHPRNPNLLAEDHVLLGLPGSRYVNDRVEAERQLVKYAREHPDAVCTSLRFGPMVGPTVRNWTTRYLTLPTPLTVLGSDPLVQFLHETDAVDALTRAVARDFHGAWNIVADGVLPLSTAVRLCRRIPLPLPGRMARAWVRTAWALQLVNTPPTFVDFLRYLCVADGRRMREDMGFVPRYGSQEALAAFAGTHLQPDTAFGGMA